METLANVEYIQSVTNSGRAVDSYHVQIGDGDLNYLPFVIDDPVPTGRQLLETAGRLPIEDHLIFQVLSNGLLEELRPDETTDLRTRGIEKFLVFRNDRSFRLELDGRVIEWGGRWISGITLKLLAGVDAATYRVWLEVRGAEDRLIDDAELVDLDKPGIERFFTGIAQTTEGLGQAVLPVKCRRYLTEHSIAFEEISEGAHRGVILRQFRLPANHFLEGQSADILILLPDSYPDSPPDMFYALPWLRLIKTQRYPRKADHAHSFGGQSWQRWSRHNNAWRPGVDGIWSMIKRVESALEDAPREAA